MPILKQNKYYQSGFSLIEVLLAMFILVVMLLLYGAASNSIVLNRNAKQQDLALRIAQSSLEDLRNTVFDSLPASGSLSHAHLSLLSDSALNLSMVDVTSDLKRADVVLTWNTTGGSPRTVTLTTYISRYGL